MNKKIRFITETALMLALLVSLQALTKGFGQLVTGSCVNAILAVSVLVGGLGSGITVALVSPVLAFVLGIAPQILTVPAIMAGNTVYVVVLYLLADREGKSLARQAAAWLIAAIGKFAALYLIVVKLICGVMAPSLLAAGTLKEPMLKALPATFSWPQLITALIGGAVALVIVPVIRKALHKYAGLHYSCLVCCNLSNSFAQSVRMVQRYRCNSSNNWFFYNICTVTSASQPYFQYNKISSHLSKIHKSNRSYYIKFCRRK